MRKSKGGGSGGWPSLLPICAGLQSPWLTVAFAGIGMGTGSFAILTSASMESPEYVYMLFNLLSHSHSVYCVKGILALYKTIWRSGRRKVHT